MRWYISQKSIFLLAFFLVGASVAYAHVPYLVGDRGQNELIPVDSPEVSYSYYGELKDFPQTYEIKTNEQLRLKVALLVPDIPEAENNVSGIIVRQIEGTGRVGEVARLTAENAGWQSFYEPFGGDWYRRGPEFDEMVDPGVYRIEVSTPDNIGKYVLVVGYLEKSDIGYIETLRRIAGIKVFFGESQFLVVRSPFVYIPLLVLFGIFALIVYLRMKRIGDRML